MNTELIKLMEYLSDKEVVTFELLEQTTQRTRRQILYRLDKINDLLKIHSLNPLKIENKKIMISREAQKVLKQEVQSQKNRLRRRDYSFEKEERIAYIYISLFIRKDQDYIGTDYLAAGLQVSRTTLFSDIKELKQTLKNNKIELMNDHESGYYLYGKETDIRNELMREIISLFAEKSDSLICNLLIKENRLLTFEETRKRIEAISADHGVEFVEKRLDEFVYIFIFLYTRIISGESVPDVVTESIMTSFKEYRFTAALVNSLDGQVEIRQEDLLYITSWILGVSFGSAEEITKDYDIISEFVYKTVERFNAVSGRQQELTRDTFHQLYAHMRPAYYRLAFNLPVLNPLTEQIQTEFPELFRLVKETMKPFRMFFGKEVPDSEIAYLTIHFACIYRIRENEPVETLSDGEEIPRALIVCSNGIGSSMILYNELTEMFPSMYFYRPIAMGQLSTFDQKVDLIFTTDTLESANYEEVPVIRVHPIISNAERGHLINEVNLKWNRNLLADVEELLGIIGKYADIFNREELVNELIIYKAGSQGQRRTRAEDDGLHLLDLFRKEYVQLGKRAENWQDAVRISYEAFLNAGVITQNYVDKTIEAVEEKGPYIVIAKHIALAHSLPEDGALKDAMGLTVLEEPVSFGESENDPVKYIFTLSITGDRDHMAAMSELVNLFNDPYFWHIVDKTEEPEIIVNYMEAVCG